MTEDTAIGRVAARSLQLMKGEYHKQQRRLMQPAFHREQLTGYHDTMVSLTRQMSARWQPGSTIELHQEMEHLTRHIVVRTLFGLEDDAAIEHMGALMQRMVSALSLALVFPFAIPGTPYHRALRVAGELETILRQLIAHKRTHGGGNDLLSTLIDARDEDGGALSDAELLSHTFTLFSAGHETTTNALTWTLFLLDQHPHNYALLLAELDETLHGEPPTAEQLRSLPVLDCVVKESLRLMPPAVLGMRRATAVGELGGFTVPAGATVIYSGFVTHRLTSHYPEPNCFIPERWATLKPTPYEYIPFSAGAHRCIGAEFAIHELKAVLATLLQQRRPTVLSNAVISTNLTMRPSRGMPMHVLLNNGASQRSRVRGNIHKLVDLTS